MKINRIDLIKKHEGLRLEAYLPTPNDVWTIGYGHTHTTKQGMKITEKQAEALLRRDIAWAEKAVNNLVVVPLTQNQFDALVSFTFNVGEGAFGSSTLLRLLNSRDYEGAANQFPRWNKQKGKVLCGLTRRREEERKLFLS
jgi:lysozyme